MFAFRVVIIMRDEISTSRKIQLVVNIANRTGSVAPVNGSRRIVYYVQYINFLVFALLAYVSEATTGARTKEF